MRILDERGRRGLTVTTYNYGVETVRAIHPTPGDKAARMAAFFIISNVGSWGHAAFASGAMQALQAR
jgi:hypothetical protein